MSDKEAASPLWISHRGLKEHAVENTFEAFTNAVEAGFTALETDLRLSKDNHIVLSHDATLERLAGDSRCVAELTRTELEGIQLRGGGRLFFLEQFMSEFRSSNWSFDIKPEHGKRTIKTLAKLLEHVYPEKASGAKIRFCTWRRNHEQLLTQNFPQAAYYARKAECWQAGLAVFLGAPGWGRIKAGRTYAIPPRYGGISLFRKSFVEHYHCRGARTIAFLPRRDSEAEAALLANFDEILTDGRILDA
ncbi:glycerophosphodiester phosphodiesterase [Planctomycetota bacterium]